MKWACEPRILNLSGWTDLSQIDWRCKDETAGRLQNHLIWGWLTPFPEAAGMTLLKRRVDPAVKTSILEQSGCMYGGGGVGCCELAYFLTKSFLRSADSQRGWWCQEPQWRPPARVRAALCSQQYLISLRGKFGHLVVEVGRHMTWAAVPAVAMLSTDLSDYVCLLLMKWDLN